jgi:hypothetical protein
MEQIISLEYQVNRLIPMAAQHRLHLTAFGAVRGGHLAEKVISSRRVSPVPAAGEPYRWVARTGTGL